MAELSDLQRFWPDALPLRQRRFMFYEFRVGELVRMREDSGRFRCGEVFEVTNVYRDRKKKQYILSVKLTNDRPDLKGFGMKWTKLSAIETIAECIGDRSAA